MNLQSSLKWRLALTIAAAAAVGALLISQFASHLSRTQIEHDQSALLQNIAVRLTSQLAHDMSSRANEIQFLAGHDTVRNPQAPAPRKQAVFEQMRKAYPFYAWIGISDTEGNITAGTDNMLVGKSVAQRDWFTKGREGLHFGDAHDAFLLAKLLPKPPWDDLPLRLVDLSTPVYDANGHFIGVLCGHLSLDWAFEVREAMLDQLATDQLDVVVLNREGKVLMGTPRLPSLKVDLSNLSSYQGLAKNTRQVALEVWPDGQRYLTAAVRETPFRNYSGMGWVVMARKSEAAAFGPADVLSHSILAAGLATAVVFMLVLVFVLHRRLRPLEAISAAAQRLQADDLQAVIPVPEGNDELAVFARSLAGLVRTLQQRNDDLRLAARVFNESGQGILIADAQNRIVRINRAFSRITGYASDEVLGPMPSVLSSGRHSAAFYESMWQTLSRQGTWQGEIWNRSKLGQVYPEWLSIDTLRNEQGEVTHYIGIFDDITEKKEYERRLVHLANYDVLTDLPNRNLFEKEVLGLIARISQNNQGLALMFVDLDNLNP